MTQLFVFTVDITEEEDAWTGWQRIAVVNLADAEVDRFQIYSRDDEEDAMRTFAGRLASVIKGALS